MILPPRVQGVSRRSFHRARPNEPDWPSFVAGIGAFLTVAAGCLYLLVHLAP